MEQVKVIHALPIDVAGYYDMVISATAVELSVKFGYGSKKDGRKCLVEFANVLAYRFHDEMHCDVLDEAADSIIEIQNSGWLKKLRDAEPFGIGGVSGKHHFAALLNDQGYLEVIAEMVSVKIVESNAQLTVPDTQ